MELKSDTQRKLDNSAEAKHLKKIEATLFISARWLSIKQLVELTDINPVFLESLLKNLQNCYNKRDSAIEIIEKNRMWKMDVRAEYHRMINKIATGSAEFSKAEQETLAIIAYKQPVKQSIIVKIRGNKAYEHVKHFIEVGLIRAKKSGRTKELSLSEEFYDYFHVKPKEKGAGGIEQIEQIEKLEETWREEGKELKEKIKEEKEEGKKDAKEKEKTEAEENQEK